MLSKSDIEVMSHISIISVEKNSLTDIATLNIDINQPIEKRIDELFSVLKNPYCFISGGVPVKVEFTPDGKPLDDIITDLFIGLNNR